MQTTCDSVYRSKYEQSKSGALLARCGKCHKRMGIWRGSAFQGTSHSVRKCYNLVVGYAARLSNWQACIDKGVSEGQMGRLWKYFRAAEYHQG